MKTYTTAKGTTVTVEGTKVTCVTTTGKTLIESLCLVSNNTLGALQLDSATAEWLNAQYAQFVSDREAALEAAVPGVHKMMELSSSAYNESERYGRAFNRMMEDERNDGARPPKAENRSFSEQLSAMRETHPRAALYLKAKAQCDGASWSDNTGKGAAGEKAMAILAAGGTIEDAEQALAVRRELVD